MRAEADARMSEFMLLTTEERNTILSQIKNKEAVENKWGFLKNIVNIDRFFSSGVEERRETDAERRERLRREAEAAARQRRLDEERRRREAEEEAARKRKAEEDAARRRKEEEEA